MWLIIVIIVGVILGIIINTYKDKSTKKRLEEEAEMLNLSSRAKSSTASMTQTNAINHQCDVAGLRFAISPDRQTAYMLYNTERPTRAVPVKDITGCEIVRDGNASGSIGRAVAGGIIAGGAGAIIGAASGSGVPQRYSLMVYINDLQNPSVEYSLLNSSTPHTKSYYETVSRFAESVSATVRVLVSQNQAN